MACPTCGFDDRSVSPADAAVAVRSYDRRFRSLLARRDDEDRDDSLLRRRAATGWSALDHAAYAASGFETIAEALRRALVSDRPGVTLPGVDGTPPGNPGEVEAVLTSLGQSTDKLAGVIEGASGEDWNRRASADGSEVTGLDVARLGVHLGIHHLRAAERVLDEVRGALG